MQRFTRFRKNLRNLRISPDICYVRMTDIVNILTIYGQRAHLLNNNMEYPTSHLYFLGIHTSLYTSVYTKKTQVTIKYHAIENTLTNFCRE